MRKLSKEFMSSRFTYFVGSKYFPNLTVLAEYIDMDYTELFQLILQQPNGELNQEINGFNVSIKNKENDMKTYLLNLKTQEV